ncbi:lytic transglycosylase domain-containing protein [Dietzia sp. ANT_WB102]|uniref:lytic transglycosylase domain-containing protein n=1 Tax=Dietzia sp. ANT_WB102 TaxID=2597345 RepID=UPI0011EEF4A1|nr:lytic transglycosylase domain-containing protein [Dietzia sp. ANT_WB102]KAA0919242.1 lytic transglycosylase domain-containing protein [Dietzia sp. ANT_WB102]
MPTLTPRATASIAGLLAIAVLSSSCSYGPTRQAPIPIPPGIPPAAGAPVPTIDINAPGRTSDQLREWAAGINEAMNIPVAALAAYGNAAETMRQTRPECSLAWTTLAGIGHVETRHGRYQGASLSDDGYALPPIIGIKLDGSPGFADLPDTDDGEWDGDTEHDRAVGPMQFIPESWRKYGRDASGDGRADPNQIDDAAVAAARLLCDAGGDLSQAENWQRAVLAYNASREYVMDVRDAAAAYSVGTTAP